MELDYYNVHHRSCCRCCHIKVGCSLLGILELLIVTTLLAGLSLHLYLQSLPEMRPTTLVSSGRGKSELAECGSLEPQPDTDCPFYSFRNEYFHHGKHVAVVILIIWIGVIVSLFYGICTTESLYLIPHVAMQGISALFTTAYLSLFLWTFALSYQWQQLSSFNWTYFHPILYAIAAYIAYAVQQIYTATVVLRCIKYFRRIDV